MAEADEKPTTPKSTPRVSGQDVARFHLEQRGGFNSHAFGREPIGGRPQGQIPPDTPPAIPPEEILQWFADGFAEADIREQPMPSLEQAEELAKMLRQYQALRPDTLNPTIQRAADRILDAATALANALPILDQAAAIIAELPEQYRENMIAAPQAAIVAIEGLIRLYPPRGRGKKSREAIPLWPTIATAWLDDVRRVLERAGWHGIVGMSRPNAVPPYVVSRMIEGVFPGEHVSPATIQRRLRAEREAWKRGGRRKKRSGG